MEFLVYMSCWPVFSLKSLSSKCTSGFLSGFCKRGDKSLKVLHKYDLQGGGEGKGWLRGNPAHVVTMDSE